MNVEEASRSAVILEFILIQMINGQRLLAFSQNLLLLFSLCLFLAFSGVTLQRMNMIQPSFNLTMQKYFYYPCESLNLLFMGVSQSKERAYW